MTPPKAWDHGKRTDEEVRAFRALADQNSTEFLEGLLGQDGCVPEYVQVVRELLAGRRRPAAVAGPCTEDGVRLGRCWPGDPDYRFTSLIAARAGELGRGKMVVSFKALASAVGTWQPHDDPAPGETVPQYRLCDMEREARQALARFGYQVVE